MNKKNGPLMGSSWTLTILLACWAGTPAQANLPVEGFPRWFNKSFSNSDTYRIGDEWGKKPVSEADLADATDVFRRAALATAAVGGGTGFYLGQYAGHFVMATNHHVFPNASGCQNKQVQFKLGQRKFPCSQFFGTWTDIDLTLFSIKVDRIEDQTWLASVAGNFAFRADIYPGQPLLTIGHGSAENPFRRLVANQDSDCKVFSARNEFQFMADPDDLNPGPYKAWSFANGCDVSHGDSGSAMVDRETGQVVGIIWTGRIPKSPTVQDSSFLDRLLSDSGPEIWKELSYAVPAAKMGEHLAEVSGRPTTPAATREMINALLAH